MDSISKRFENQIKQNLHQQPYVPSILSRPSKNTNGVQNRNSQEENPATSSEIPSNIKMSSNTPSYGFHASNGHSDCDRVPMRGSVCETVPARHFAPATPNLGKQIHQDNENQHEVIETTESQVESSSAVRNADIDLNTTPALPKKRRKKHRPKVVIQGKPKPTPRPKTPKVGESKTVKRKYYARKAKENTLVSPKDDADPTWKPSPKRVLGFEVESDQQGLRSCLNSEFPAPRDSSGSGIRSSILRRRKPTQGQGVIVENTPSRVQFDLNLCGDLLSDTLFPHPKKRRTEKGQITVTSSTSTGEKQSQQGQIHPSSTNFASLPKNVRGQLGDLQSCPLMLNLGQMGSKKQRTKRSPRHRSRASLAAFLEPKGGKRRNDMVHGMIKKKRSKRVSHKVVTASRSRGSQGDIPSLDQLIQRFYSISIDHERRTRDVIIHERNEIVPFGHTPAQECNVIVPYDQVKGFNSKALVPVKPKKLRKTHAKVDIDPETDRVWKQLMGMECDQGEETDVDKEKWWEEERSIFRGRANSFIARMHIIQGDRRFTKWKGSVVDSVIGVFLTQNVSDHLSSSAFMSLAARFPLQSTSNHRTEVIVEEPDEPEQCHENLSAELRNKHVVHQGERDSVAEDAAIEIQQIESNLNGHIHSSEKAFSETTVIASVDTPKAKRKSKSVKEKKNEHWDSLRKDASLKGEQRKRTAETMDTLDYEAMRCAEVSEIADAIRARGMNNRLAERMKAFLNRLVEDHGSIDLEWLRDISPDKAKDYLLSILGLGLKSVECVRLLTLHQLAFPVDTNVGRIAVRLGWVPLQPLPEEVQLHLLELYPMLDSIQKYLWPRLCKLDQPTLYELHYQLITFGKVFCTKKKPNCNACPMRAECRHFASAFTSARLALPAPQEKGIVASNVPLGDHSQAGVVKGPRLSLQEPSFTTGIPYGTQCRVNQCEHQDFSFEASSRTNQCEPIVEVPASPVPEPIEATLSDIEDAFLNGDHDEEEIPTINLNEIPTINLNVEEFALTLQNQETNMQVYIDAVSTALVTYKGPSIPEPKLKNVGRLRTEHRVYVLPDDHILLIGRDKREPDDPSPYMLAIWTPGEIADSTLRGEQNCSCNNETCCSCNSVREKDIVKGTLLIPCRTAMKGSFPLNGTYFQVNEVFADHASSRKPIEVPRSYLWNLTRRIVYFGTSVTSIFKGLTLDVIQSAFGKGFVCVRGFDVQARAPRPLYARLHLAASKMGKNGAKIHEE